MRDISATFADALAARYVVARDFVWIEARDRVTGEPETLGTWNDVGTVTAEVIDGLTGEVEERDFIGSGTLIQVSEIRLVSDVSVREVKIEMSQIDENIEQAVFGYTVKGATIQIYRGALDPTSRRLVAPAVPRFVGFVDRAPIVIPREGEYGSLTLICASHSRELTRGNPDVRSDASQRRRNASDRFFRYSEIAQEIELFWGMKQGKPK